MTAATRVVVRLEPGGVRDVDLATVGVLRDDPELLAGVHVEDALGRLDPDPLDGAVRPARPNGAPAAIQPRMAP